MLSDDICLCRHAAHEEQKDAAEQHYFEEAAVATHSFGSKSFTRAISCTFRLEHECQAPSTGHLMCSRHAGLQPPQTVLVHKWAVQRPGEKPPIGNNRQIH